MSRQNGSTIVLITFLCFVVLGLGSLAGWQWHRAQMETVLLENMKLQKEVEDCEAGACPVQVAQSNEATSAGQPTATASAASTYSFTSSPSKSPRPSPSPTE